MSAPPDYYRILHVTPDAPAAIIHASYRTLVQRALGTTRGSDEVALLDAAYAVLGDTQRRAIDIWVTWPQAAPIQGEMRNLSLNGMSFASAVRLQLNQIVRIDCSELRALGRVAHIERDSASSKRFRVGVEFMTLRFRQVRGSFVSAEA